ncbi:MAG: exopolysaccharide biosynthesis polyprenyl glycosylphosphotransferase [Planctomycetota bacterium]
MIHRHAQLPTLLTVVADAFTTTAALAAAYGLRFSSGLFAVDRDWTPERYVEALPPAVLLSIATYSFVGNYRRTGVRKSGDPGLRDAVGGVLAATLLLLAGALLYRNEYQFSRAVPLLFLIVGIPLVWSGRVGAGEALRRLHRRGIGVRMAVLAGEGATAEALARALEEEAWLGVRIAARVREPRELAAALAEHAPGQVFVAYAASDPDRTRRALEALADAPVDVRILPDLAGSRLLHPEVALLGGLPVITLRQTPIHGVNRVAKRTFDLVAGLVLSLLLLPVALFAGLLVLLLSGRPVFYAQERMGLDGRRFPILKLRTMRRDAEGDGAVWSRENDDRTTGIGRILRRFSLDELPQLLNVLKGEMSLVGPRPERPVFIEEFRKDLPGYMLRLRIPAGLTGLAQVKGLRGDTDLSERLRYDLIYLERWSLIYDVEILLRTAGRVILGR